MLFAGAKKTPAASTPLKVRNFRLLFGGQAISVMGDALYLVAFPWLVLTTGGSAEELGIVLAAFGIARAVSMLAGGWLSDRLRPRKLMLIADAARLALVGILAVIALGGHPTLVQLCAIAVPLGAFGGVFLPASQAILPETLSPENLQAGHGLMLASRQGANLLGAAGAGVVVAAVSAAAALAIDAGTFLVSALSLALMRTPRSAVRKHGAPREKDGVLAPDQGKPVSLWRFLRASGLIQGTLLIFVLFGLVSGGLIEVALPSLVRGPFRADASAFGLIPVAWAHSSGPSSREG